MDTVVTGDTVATGVTEVTIGHLLFILNLYIM